MARTKRASYRRLSRSPMRRAQAARSSGADTVHTPRIPRRFPEFAGQFENHVSTQRKTYQKCRRASFSAEFPDHCQQIAGQTGMIKGPAEVLRATAGAHVKAMRRETRPQRRRAQAPDIAGFPRTLQSVNHENLAARLAVRTLRAHQYLHVRLGTVQEEHTSE